jgi:uncharacterized peroxidase-related enzyme
MSRLTAPDLETVPDSTKDILGNVARQFGFVPNMFATIASNPTVLEVVMTLQSALRRVLDAKTRHTIALAVSQANGCDYCLAMHAYVSSEFGGMPRDDIDLARAGGSTDPRRAAAGRFAREVVVSHGQVSDMDLTAVRDAGYTDSQILAIVTVAVQALLTNFINNVNRTDIDVPAVSSPGAPE